MDKKTSSSGTTSCFLNKPDSTGSLGNREEESEHAKRSLYPRIDHCIAIFDASMSQKSHYKRKPQIVLYVDPNTTNEEWDQLQRNLFYHICANRHPGYYLKYVNVFRFVEEEIGDIIASIPEPKRLMLEGASVADEHPGISAPEQP